MKRVSDGLIFVAAVAFSVVGGVVVLAVALVTGSLRALGNGIEPRQKH